MNSFKTNGKMMAAHCCRIIFSKTKNAMKKYTDFQILLSMLMMLSLQTLAQPNFPDDDEIYRDDVTGRIDILIHPDTLQWIYDNPESNTEWHATFIFDNGTVHDTIEDIGFRLRGNTSRHSAKKSFKVSFNTFESGRDYYGVEKMNLNGEHNDPTVARSKVSWDLCRRAGIPAPRSNFVRVYINNNYYGLYINVEHIDEEFVDKRYGNQSGNLFKCLWPADLNYLGDDPELYKFTAGDRRAYALKTNKAADDYSDIAHFIDVLNNTPSGDLACELEKIFNVQDYLKVAAMDVFTANWDGYIWNKNNFYLYHNGESGKFEYIPYDLDNTYGIDWFDEDWAVRDIYNWEHQSEYRPLYERLMQVPKYRKWYSYYLLQILELMNPETYFERIDEIRDQIYPFILGDDYYTYDYGFDPQDFLNSYETGLGMHVPYGLKEYITSRYNAAADQLETNNIQPIVNYMKSNHSGPGSTFELSVYVFDDENDVSASLTFNMNNSGWESILLAEEENGKFSGQFEIPDGEGNFLYQVEAMDMSGNITLYPCEPVEVNFGPGEVYQLFINEFLAGNQTTNTDEAGDYDDWLEIYNAGNDPVWLGDKYLTDNFDNPDKWAFPDYTIEPQEFLLVWCDDDPNQGPFHTTFKISKDGEELAIVDNEATGYQMIDSVSFGVQTDDVSYGRDPDAGDDWIFYEHPTPGLSNALNASVDMQGSEGHLLMYPNPVFNNTVYLSKVSDIAVYSVNGQKLMEYSGTDRFSVATLPDGFYLIRTRSGETFKILKQ
jgi:hypothetical protein